MSTAFLNSPFAAKIWRENLAIIGKGLLSALLFFVLLTAYLGQHQLRTEAQYKAETIANNIAGSLQSNDRKAVEAVILKASHSSEILSVIVYDKNGLAIIAWDDFSQFGQTSKLPESELVTSVNSKLQIARLNTTAPVIQDAAIIGKIQISSSLRALYWQTLTVCVIGLLLGGAISAVCAYFLTKAQVLRLAPVMDLGTVSEQVVTLGDYSLRAIPHDGHELNYLNQHFNQMMTRIESWESDRQSEIRERREAERRLDILANHDSLTKLPNRSYFHHLLTNCVEVAVESKQLAALMFIDLDNFKPLNAQFSYDAGDLILATIANRLCTALRNTDTLCRVDGDEFAAILPQIDSPEMAVALAERLLRAINQPMTLRGKKIIITGSIGIACCPLHAVEQRLFLHHTDQALKKAKAAGKNHFYLYGSEAVNRLVSVTAGLNAAPLARQANS